MSGLSGRHTISGNPPVIEYLWIPAVPSDTQPHTLLTTSLAVCGEQESDRFLACQRKLSQQLQDWLRIQPWTLTPCKIICSHGFLAVTSSFENMAKKAVLIKLWSCQVTGAVGDHSFNNLWEPARIVLLHTDTLVNQNPYGGPVISKLHSTTRIVSQEVIQLKETCICRKKALKRVLWDQQQNCRYTT